VAVTGGRSLRINYLLEDTALYGGVKVPLHHANLLHRSGHEVRVLSRGPRPSWFPVEAQFSTVPEFSAETVPAADLHVATFWTTIAPAASLPSGQAVHYCQGFEASLTHNVEEHPRILEAYGRRLPAFAVSPHLADLIRSRFGRPAVVVPPALESWWRPRMRFGPAVSPRVLVPSPFENYLKGVPTALEAILLLRSSGPAVRVVRISQWPLVEAEQELLPPDEFHHHIEPSEVARVMAGCDLLLAPSWEQEGFGLWVLEAMACGVPVVASRIPAHLGFASDAAVLVPPKEAPPLADAARAVLSDRRRWRRMRLAGRKVARRFSEKRTAQVLEEAVHWAVEGGWGQPS
jgi:glycosyltransferase involved in cell wall biosynthesis